MFGEHLSSHSWYIRAIDNNGNATNSDTYNISYLCGTIATQTAYCSAVIYDEWQDQCVNNIQYRNIKSTSPSGCALTSAQIDNAKRQCSSQTETQQQTPTENIPLPTQTGGQAEQTNLISKIVDEAKNIIEQKITALDNFITNGTQSTLILGAGERKGVVESFKSAFGRVPETERDWEDVIKIANGRWPSQRDQNTEKNAEAAFRKIYQRNPDMTNARDNAAVTIISYGLRPIERNLESEKKAIIYFKNIYGYAPKSAMAWDIVRAIAYSGAKR